MVGGLILDRTAGDQGAFNLGDGAHVRSYDVGGVREAYRRIENAGTILAFSLMHNVENVY